MYMLYIFRTGFWEHCKSKKCELAFTIQKDIINFFVSEAKNLWTHTTNLDKKNIEFWPSCDPRQYKEHPDMYKDDQYYLEYEASEDTLT